MPGAEEQVQARAGICAGAGFQSSVKEMFPQWQLAQISTTILLVPALPNAMSTLGPAANRHAQHDKEHNTTISESLPEGNKAQNSRSS
jgi:hypothetical protein